MGILSLAPPTFGAYHALVFLPPSKRTKDSHETKDTRKEVQGTAGVSEGTEQVYLSEDTTRRKNAKPRGLVWKRGHAHVLSPCVADPGPTREARRSHFSSTEETTSSPPARPELELQHHGEGVPEHWGSRGPGGVCGAGLEGDRLGPVKISFQLEVL